MFLENLMWKSFCVNIRNRRIFFCLGDLIWAATNFNGIEIVGLVIDCHVLYRKNARKMLCKNLQSASPQKAGEHDCKQKKI